MSKFCKGLDRGKAGFTLPEVLVALIIATLFLSTLAQVLGNAWTASRRPMEQVSALAVARAVAEDAKKDARTLAPHGRIQRFDYVTTIVPFETETRISKLAPKVGGLQDAKQPNDGAANGLQRISVTVTAPSGRRLTFETVRLAATAKN
jgi:prepilin-type N-terminal cleavage/methylation domain-containing protein